MNLISKIKKEFKDLTSFNSTSFNHIHNLLFEEPCPRCGIYIQKSGGCNHMHCQRCKHEFCWFCLGAFYRYQHYDKLACPFRYTATVGAMFIIALFLNFKVIYTYEILFTIQYFLMYNISALILVDVYASSIMLYLTIYYWKRAYKT